MSAGGSEPARRSSTTLPGLSPAIPYLTRRSPRYALPGATEVELPQDLETELELLMVGAGTVDGPVHPWLASLYPRLKAPHVEVGIYARPKVRSYAAGCKRLARRMDCCSSIIRGLRPLCAHLSDAGDAGHFQIQVRHHFQARQGVSGPGAAPGAAQRGPGRGAHAMRVGGPGPLAGGAQGEDRAAGELGGCFLRSPTAPHAREHGASVDRVALRR